MRIFRQCFMISVLTMLAHVSGAQVTSNPVAQKNAVIVTPNARFTMLTSSLVRMEWSSDGQFTDDASFIFINRKLDVPEFSTITKDGRLFIETKHLLIEYRISPDSFSSSNLTVRANLNADVRFAWQPGMHDNANLKGTMRTLDGVDSGSVNMLENGILSRNGWALIDDSQSYLFDGDPHWNWVKDRPAKPRQDWYFFGYGHRYKEALYDFSLVAGKIPLPPRYAFGYWWSRYWIYSDREMRDLVNTFHELQIPIDVMIIDMDWHDTYGFRGNATIPDGEGGIVGWTGYTWNKNLFPKPEKLLQWMESKGIKNALNLHPSSGIPPMEEKYAAFAKAYGFDTTGKKYIPYYGSDKKWSRIYFDSIIRPLEKSGVDFWWLDWQQFPYDKLKPALSNTWWLNYMFFTDMEKQGKRPMLFHRWGGLGNHRYQIGFSGDSYITWKQLAFQPSFTAAASNVGYGYWSHDIGGHQPGDPQNAELFGRWVQWGVFSPILRTHSTKKAIIDRRMWKMKEEFLHIREAIQLRYELHPYIYTAARKTYDSVVSLCRPMYYQYPDKDEAYSNMQQYQFGDDMIVAPVVSPADSLTQLASQRVWLPEGEWFEWPTGSRLKGNCEVVRHFAAQDIPVYVRSGSIIPMFAKSIRNLQRNPDTLVLTVFKGGNGKADVYEDEGNGQGYQQSSFAKTRIIQQSSTPGNIVLRILPVLGHYPGMRSAKAYNIRVPGTLPPARVTVNGKGFPYHEEEREGYWTYRGMDLEARVCIPPSDRKKELVIEMRFGKSIQEEEVLLKGKVALFKRMPKVLEMLKYEISNVDWGAAIPDAILTIEQMPTRIDYDVKNCIQYLKETEEKFSAAVKAIRDIPDVDAKKIERILHYLPDNVND